MFYESVLWLKKSKLPLLWVTRNALGRAFRCITIELPLTDLCGRDVKKQSFQNLGMDRKVDFRLSLLSDSQNDTTESGLPVSGS